MKQSTTVYDKVVDITRDYLGPAGARFVDRMVRNHLQKEPQKLNMSDIAKLTEWSRLALGMLTKDTKLMNEYSKRLLQIAE